MEQLARFLARRLVESGEGDEQYIDWYRYKIEVRLGQIATYGTMLLIALATRNILEGFLFLLFLLPLRKVAGGYHAKIHFNCYLSSEGFFCMGLFVLPLFQKAFPIANFVFLILSSIAVFAFAPIIHPNLPQKQGQRSKMRQISLLVLAAQVTVILVSMMLGAPAVYIEVSCNGMLSAGILLTMAKITHQEGTVNYEG